MARRDSARAWAAARPRRDIRSRASRETSSAIRVRLQELLEEMIAPRDAIEVVRVPGAWEIPQAVAWAAHQPGTDAIIALGCLIRGETAHFDVIADEVGRGLGAAARRSGTPVILGVLTTETEAQALERADPVRGDKGREAALAALEMAALHARLGAR